jgi:flagellar hook protein FlgE
LAVSANNIANINTDGFKSSRAVMQEQPTGSGVRVSIEKTDHGADLGQEMVNQLIALRYGQANGKAFKIQNETLGELIEMWA